MASCCQGLEGSYNTKMAKTVAILKGIQFSSDCGLTPCSLESDAEAVVNWIKNKKFKDSVFGVILNDILVLIDKMGNIPINFTPTAEANKVAEGLAMKAVKEVEDRFWMEDFPGYVRNLVLVDMPVKAV
ncbi:hypothetical protein Ddye_002991 [Dipteronia dyeriana]|uniref:RNase H type-1 domain-containing protein n=1 Tax=Dipteronia dyeriana TaxID=168575 RepID=A0AAD9XRX4_9ROSI|nr:hypothetical protein Ddye_002991 [Dipteronia dyeriana]